MLTDDLIVQAIQTSSKQLSIHLALSALANFTAKSKGTRETLSVEAVTAEAKKLLPEGAELPDEFEDCVGEVYVFSLFIFLPSFHSFC